MAAQLPADCFLRSTKNSGDSCRLEPYLGVRSLRDAHNRLDLLASLEVAD